ncbi:MAG: methyltransferase domain-containing protein [Candidatus Dojkabacteria bacterium]|nr:methyltransferase domain-containing protein [Candidatus Dojkabacteria bacterium]
MSGLITVKDILVGYDVTAPAEKEYESKTKRRASHEFQAYAYKLAHDLNHLENLKIYMRLVKITDRSLLERVYSFVADSNSDHKGPLFLWKLKQIKKEIKVKKHKKNFDYDFVTKNMRSIRNSLYSQILKNGNKLNENEMINIFTSKLDIKLSKFRKSKRILFLGNCSTLLNEMCDDLGLNVYGLDISPKLTAAIKESCKITPKSHHITKDFLTNKYKSEYFEYVMISQLWSLVPIESENIYLKELNRIIKKGSSLVIEYKENFTKCEQKWKEIMIEGKEELSFLKRNNSADLIEKVKKEGFELEDLIQTPRYSYLILKKK